MSPEEFRKRYVSDLTSAVKLDNQQIAALNAVLDRTHDEFDKLNEKVKVDRDAMNEKWRPDREAIHNHQVESINGMLRPDQLPLYEAFSRRTRSPAQTARQQRKKQ